MNAVDIAKRIPIKHNVSINVLDANTGKVLSSHTGHNAATNSMMVGIAHYLTGDGVLNQAKGMLGLYIPKYISLGTMGLINQDEDENGLPSGIGTEDYSNKTYNDLTYSQLERLGKPASDTTISEDDAEILNFTDYIWQVPGYGADGSDPNSNNDRKYLGLGPTFANREDKTTTINCELISDSYPRTMISFRDIIPEIESEYPQTIDVVFSTMISTGALSQFRAPGNDYLFITECGLWSERPWYAGGDNGLLAGYRIAPPNKENWSFEPYGDVTAEQAKLNRTILKENIIRVGINEVVQVVWKIQLGAMDQLGGLSSLYPQYQKEYIWTWYGPDNKENN